MVQCTTCITAFYLFARNQKIKKKIRKYRTTNEWYAPSRSLVPRRLNANVHHSDRKPLHIAISFQPPICTGKPIMLCCVYWSGYKQAYIYIYWIFINDLFLGIPSNTHTIHVYANKLIIINGWILYVFDQISEAHSDRMQMNVCFDSFVYRAHTAHARAHNNWLRMVRIGRLSAKRYTNTLRWAMSNNTRTRTRGQIYWHEKSLRIWLPNRSSSRKRFADYSHYTEVVIFSSATYATIRSLHRALDGSVIKHIISCGWEEPNGLYTTNWTKPIFGIEMTAADVKYDERWYHSITSRENIFVGIITMAMAIIIIIVEEIRMKNKHPADWQRAIS